MKKFTPIIIFTYALVCFVLAGFFVNPASQWYNSLVLPSFLPHGLVFVFAWIFVTIFTAVSAYVASRAGDGLYAYALLGAVCALWTYVFFEKQSIVLGVYIIGLLILLTLYIMGKSSDLRSRILMIPMLFWLMVAAILNYSLFMLN